MAVDFTDLKEELGNRDNYVPFHKQFAQCSAEGLTDKTKFFSFEEHPEFLPAMPWRRKLRKFVEDIKSGKCKGIDLIVCGKFGGICSGGHNQCRATRGLPPSPHEQLT